MDDEEITQKFAARRPYDKWIKENLVHLDDLAKQWSSRVNQRPRRHGTPTAPLTIHNQLFTIQRHPFPNRQASFGYTSEELIVILRPMLTTGNEPVGAMGDDTPPPR
jgi:hypothetical protein